MPTIQLLNEPKSEATFINPDRPAVDAANREVIESTRQAGREQVLLIQEGVDLAVKIGTAVAAGSAANAGASAKFKMGQFFDTKSANPITSDDQLAFQTLSGDTESALNHVYQEEQSKLWLPQAKMKFHQDFQDVRQASITTAKKMARDQALEYSKASFQQAAETTISDALGGSMEQFMDARIKITADTKDAVATNIYSAVEGGIRNRNYQARLVDQFVRDRVLTDPQQAFNWLTATPNDDLAINHYQKQQYLAAAQHGVVKAQKQQELKIVDDTKAIRARRLQADLETGASLSDWPQSDIQNHFKDVVDNMHQATGDELWAKTRPAVYSQQAQYYRNIPLSPIRSFVEHGALLADDPETQQAAFNLFQDHYGSKTNNVIPDLSKDAAQVFNTTKSLLQSGEQSVDHAIIKARSMQDPANDGLKQRHLENYKTKKEHYRKNMSHEATSSYKHHKGNQLAIELGGELAERNEVLTSFLSNKFEEQFLETGSESLAENAVKNTYKGSVGTCKFNNKVMLYPPEITLQLDDVQLGEAYRTWFESLTNASIIPKNKTQSDYQLDLSTGGLTETDGLYRLMENIDADGKHQTPVYNPLTGGAVTLRVNKTLAEFAKSDGQNRAVYNAEAYAKLAIEHANQQRTGKQTHIPKSVPRFGYLTQFKGMPARQPVSTTPSELKKADELRKQNPDQYYPENMAKYAKYEAGVLLVNPHAINKKMAEIATFRIVTGFQALPLIDQQAILASGDLSVLEKSFGSQVSVAWDSVKEAMEALTAVLTSAVQRARHE